MASIRPLCPADYAIVAAISNEAAIRGLVGRPVWETAEDVAAEVAAPGHAKLIVAINDQEQIMGLTGYRLTPDGEAELFGPLVREEGHGIGAWLSSQVESLARHHGASSYSMLIGLRNGSGAAWAQWQGYEPDSEHPESVLTWVYPGELKPGHLADHGQVRRATAHDLNRIVSLYETCFPTGLRTPAQWAEVIDRCRVITVDGVVQGFLWLEEETSWVHNLCVDRAARRRGLGSRLLLTVAEEFWQEQPRKLGLVVPLDNAAPLTLFRRMGFRREIAVAKWRKRDG